MDEINSEMIVISLELTFERGMNFSRYIGMQYACFSYLQYQSYVVYRSTEITMSVEDADML